MDKRVQFDKPPDGPAHHTLDHVPTATPQHDNSVATMPSMDVPSVSPGVYDLVQAQYLNQGPVIQTILCNIVNWCKANKTEFYKRVWHLLFTNTQIEIDSLLKYAKDNKWVYKNEINNTIRPYNEQDIKHRFVRCGCLHLHSNSKSDILDAIRSRKCKTDIEKYQFMQNIYQHEIFKSSQSAYADAFDLPWMEQFCLHKQLLANLYDTIQLLDNDDQSHLLFWSSEWQGKRDFWTQISPYAVGPAYALSYAIPTSTLKCAGAEGVDNQYKMLMYTNENHIFTPATQASFFREINQLSTRDYTEIVQNVCKLGLDAYIDQNSQHTFVSKDIRKCVMIILNDMFAKMQNLSAQYVGSHPDITYRLDDPGTKFHGGITFLDFAEVLHTAVGRNTSGRNHAAYAEKQRRQTHNLSAIERANKHQFYQDMTEDNGGLINEHVSARTKNAHSRKARGKNSYAPINEDYTSNDTLARTPQMNIVDDQDAVSLPDQKLDNAYHRQLDKEKNNERISEIERKLHSLTVAQYKIEEERRMSSVRYNYTYQFLKIILPGWNETMSSKYWKNSSICSRIYDDMFQAATQNRDIKQTIIDVYMKLCSIKDWETAQEQCAQKGYWKIFEFELAYIHLLFKNLDKYRRQVVQTSDQYWKNQLRMEKAHKAIAVKTEANNLLSRQELIQMKMTFALTSKVINITIKKLKDKNKIALNVLEKTMKEEAEAYTLQQRSSFVTEFIDCGLRVVQEIYLQEEDHFHQIIPSDDFRRRIEAGEFPPVLEQIAIKTRIPSRADIKAMLLESEWNTFATFEELETTYFLCIQQITELYSEYDKCRIFLSKELKNPPIYLQDKTGIMEFFNAKLQECCGTLEEDVLSLNDKFHERKVVFFELQSISNEIDALYTAVRSLYSSARKQLSDQKREATSAFVDIEWEIVKFTDKQISWDQIQPTIANARAKVVKLWGEEPDLWGSYLLTEHSSSYFNHDVANLLKYEKQIVNGFQNTQVDENKYMQNINLKKSEIWRYFVWMESDRCQCIETFDILLATMDKMSDMKEEDFLKYTHDEEHQLEKTIEDTFGANGYWDDEISEWEEVRGEMRQDTVAAWMGDVFKLMQKNIDIFSNVKIHILKQAYQLKKLNEEDENNKHELNWEERDEESKKTAWYDEEETAYDTIMKKKGNLQNSFGTWARFKAEKAVVFQLYYLLDILSPLRGKVGLREIDIPHILAWSNLQEHHEDEDDEEEELPAMQQPYTNWQLNILKSNRYFLYL